MIIIDFISLSNWSSLTRYNIVCSLAFWKENDLATPQGNGHFMVYIVPRIERSLKCSDFDIVPVAKAILGCEHTLPSCTQEAICSNAPLAVRKTTWHCVKFCVCADLCFYALVCLCMDGCKNMFVCVCNCVFVCILILISTSAWHTDARMQSWPPVLAKQCVTGQLVAQLLLLLSVKNAILNYL